MIGRGLSTLEYGIPALPLACRLGPAPSTRWNRQKTCSPPLMDAALRQRNYLVFVWTLPHQVVLSLGSYKSTHGASTMIKSTVLSALLGALFVAGLAIAPAQAQATRTWVSGVGDDANPCSRTAPCKTWPGAISKT